MTLEKDMRRSVFTIAKMDCPSEEQMVRMRLAEMEHIESLRFDLMARSLEVYHSGSPEGLLAALDGLDLGAALLSSEPAAFAGRSDQDRHEGRALRQVLSINLFFFALEMLTGFIAGSMGLVADSLDMLADSIVYCLSLFAVGSTVARKKRIAAAAGYFQLSLGILGFAEVLRRVLTQGETPDFHLMIFISLLALVGNSLCLYLLQKAKSREAHMEASMIFTSTDIIVNAGVIAAGVLVYLTSSKLPDLIVGTMVFALVARGAYRILRLSK